MFQHFNFFCFDQAVLSIQVWLATRLLLRVHPLGGVLLVRTGGLNPSLDALFRFSGLGRFALVPTAPARVSRGYLFLGTLLAAALCVLLSSSRMYFGLLAAGELQRQIQACESNSLRWLRGFVLDLPTRHLAVWVVESELL